MARGCWGRALGRRRLPGPPRVRHLRKMRCDHRRRMAPVCLLSVFATRRHGRKPIHLFVAKQSPRRPGCNSPRSTTPAAWDTAPVCTRTDDTHARRQTLPLRLWSTPHGAGSWPPFHDRALHRDRGWPTKASPGASARLNCSPSPSSLRVVTYPTRTLP